VDAAEEDLYGSDKRGDELQAALADPKRRLQKIQEAKAALEAEAKAQRNFTDPDSRIISQVTRPSFKPTTATR
jgi:hypothetical protein